MIGTGLHNPASGKKCGRKPLLMMIYGRPVKDTARILPPPEAPASPGKGSGLVTFNNLVS